MMVSYEKFTHIIQVFEYWVSKTPNSIAVVCEEESISYADLNKKANRIAAYLSEKGVSPGDIIGICVDRSVELIVLILGILKVGGAYLPLDFSNPAARLEAILKNSNPKFVFVDDKGKEYVKIAQTVDINRLIKELKDFSEKNIKDKIEKNTLCYVIYTSGSTGEPNGVCITHNNLLHLIKAAQKVFDFSNRDTWTLFHSYAFDFSVWEIWGALCFGGKLIVVPYSTIRSPRDFYSLLVKEKVTILNQTPAAFYLLKDVILSHPSPKNNSLRKIIFGGDALDITQLYEWVKIFGEDIPQLYNMYGITETTVHVTYHLITSEDIASGKLVIGKALPFYNVYLLDSMGQEVSVGQEGEICVTGYGVSKGYLNNFQLTEIRFKRNSFNNSENIMYMSGDLGLALPDGNIKYLGRRDNQVKIRGYRIDVGEIESLLNTQSEVKLSAVVVKQGSTENHKQLIAFVELKTFQHTITPSSLRNKLKELLPDYMVPSHVYFIEKIPLTHNGKIDRKYLFNVLSLFQKRKIPMKEISTLEKLKNILEKIIEEENIDVNHNFYDIGGNSLLAINFMDYVSQQFGMDLTIKDLFEKNIVEISQMLEKNSEELSFIGD